MPRAMPRPLFLLLVGCAAFVAGVAYDHLGREARAEAPSASTVYVPPGGLVFRSLDGAPLMRVTRDANGGVLEMYDNHRLVATRLGAGHLGTPELARENPYDDVRDPYDNRQ